MVQNYQYRYVSFSVNRSGNKLLVYSVDGEFSKDWENGSSPDMTAYSNQLGREGWELAFFEPSMNHNYIAPGPVVTSATAVFKRPTL